MLSWPFSLTLVFLFVLILLSHWLLSLIGRIRHYIKNQYWFKGNGNPLQYSCLENPVDGEAWYATVHWVAKSQTRLSDFTFTCNFSTGASAISMAVPSDLYVEGKPFGQGEWGKGSWGHTGKWRGNTEGAESELPQGRKSTKAIFGPSTKLKGL